MAIDENYCLSVDHLGRPVDIYHDPDYVLKCIGYWKENLRSYLITYDDLDPLSVCVTLLSLYRLCHLFLYIIVWFNLFTLIEIPMLGVPEG